MATKYTHHNVPEEIAKKFPALQQKGAFYSQVAPQIAQSVKNPSNTSTVNHNIIPAAASSASKVIQAPVPYATQHSIAHKSLTSHLQNSMVNKQSALGKIYTHNDVPEEIKNKFPGLKCWEPTQEQPIMPLNPQ